MSNEEFVNSNKGNRNNIKEKYQKEKIRELREHLGLRRTEFGAGIGYTYQQVVRVEEGLTPVSDELADRICREYRVSREWLSGEDGSSLTVDGSGQRRSRLRQLYKESGLSQREFAKLTHTSPSMLKDIMSGRYQMTIHYAQKVEDAMGVGADWLLYGDEDAKDYPCGSEMINYLKRHPDARKELWEKMHDGAGS